LTDDYQDVPQLFFLEDRLNMLSLSDVLLLFISVPRN
jgi:hypothetical protein